MGEVPEASPHRPAWQRALALVRPSHRHTAFSATLLLMASAMLSRVIGLVRVKYIAYLLGRSAAADAFNAAFQLPDMISYFLIGGAASITLVTMLSRYRDSGQEAEGERAMSVILTIMGCVLSVAILMAEIFAPVFVHLLIGFDGHPDTAALCVHLTRILLPAQLFFLAGGVFSAVLLVQKQFAMQAITPLVYNLGTIFGGVILGKMMGVSSLALGTLAGAMLGPFALNAVVAYRTGARYRPAFDIANPGFREWVRLSIPLMLGVSLVSFDGWIMNHFASKDTGAISALVYAKMLFTAPVALGQAAGAASLPFLATLFGKSNAAGDLGPFSAAVNASVSRILAFSLLASAWMIGLAFPAVDLLFRGGSFHRADAGTMAVYFGIFSIALCFWSAQAIYARAFYAAGNTLAPMIAGTIVVLVSLPIYGGLYRIHGATGLAIASDIGIGVQTLALAVMLERRRMVALLGLEYVELARSALAAVLALGGIYLLRHFMAPDGRWGDVLLIAAGTAVWLLIVVAVLRLSRSSLPQQLLARFRT
ncbi:MAG TPA: lipid II flippase MurJ [Acidisarcina sp.]